MKDNSDILNSDHPADRNFPVPFDLTGMIERVRFAIRHAGGIAHVAEKSGVPKGTLNNLLRGADVRVSNAYAIARTCDVSLDWLATGCAEFWPSWYRAEMTGRPYAFPEGGSVAKLNPGFDAPPVPETAPAALSEPPAASLATAASIDVSRLRQAVDIIRAMELLNAPDAADRIAKAYDILSGAKP